MAKSTVILFLLSFISIDGHLGTIFIWGFSLSNYWTSNAFADFILLKLPNLLANCSFNTCWDSLVSNSDRKCFSISSSLSFLVCQWVVKNNLVASHFKIDSESFCSQESFSSWRDLKFNLDLDLSSIVIIYDIFFFFAYLCLMINGFIGLQICFDFLLFSIYLTIYLIFYYNRSLHLNKSNNS